MFKMLFDNFFSFWQEAGCGWRLFTLCNFTAVFLLMLNCSVWYLFTVCIVRVRTWFFKRGNKWILNCSFLNKINPFASKSEDQGAKSWLRLHIQIFQETPPTLRSLFVHLFVVSLCVWVVNARTATLAVGWSVNSFFSWCFTSREATCGLLGTDEAWKTVVNIYIYSFVFLLMFLSSVFSFLHMVLSGLWLVRLASFSLIAVLSLCSAISVHCMSAWVDCNTNRHV